MRSVLLTSITIPPPTVTAAEVRARAGTTRALIHKRSQPRIVSRRAAFATALAALVMSTIGVLPGAGIAAPAMLRLQFADSGPADWWLDLLLANLAEPPGGPVLDDSETFIHYQEWSMDVFEPAPTIIAHDVRTWWRPDLSGVTITADLPQPSNECLAVLGPVPAKGSRKQVFPAGEYNTLIDQPPSSDPAILAGQLETQETAGNGPQAIPRALAAFRTKYQFNRSQRVAIIKILQRIDGITYYGNVVDRAGRNGIALGIDSPAAENQGQTRDILVLDHQANVLSHEIMNLIAPPKVHLPAMTVIAYTLFF